MATTIYNGLLYTTKEINRNSRIKINGIVDGKKVNKLVGVKGLIELIGVEMANKMLRRAFNGTDDKTVCKLRRGIKIVSMLNNNINNLEWATVKENIVHAEKNNLRKKKTVKIQKLKYGIVVAEYCSIKEAAQKNDVSTSSISNRMKRKCKPRNGIEYKRIK